MPVLFRIVITMSLVVFQSNPLGAQENTQTAVDELLEIMSGNSSLELRKVTELPRHLQGELFAIAEFDDERQTWHPMARPQAFGRVAADRITVLGYEVGQDGFVEARYVKLADRRIVSYTGVTTDRRLSVNLYDDENDPENIFLQVRIGPQTFKYLIMRPLGEAK
jgi:hypothetical protein